MPADPARSSWYIGQRAGIQGRECDRHVVGEENVVVVNEPV